MATLEFFSEKFERHDLEKLLYPQFCTVVLFSTIKCVTLLVYVLTLSDL